MEEGGIPIITEWNDDSRRRFNDALWGVNDQVRARIDALQPATRREADPTQDPLAVLQELWNIDKHRTVHQVRMFVGVVDVEPRSPFPGVPDLAFDVVWKAAVGPFVDDAPLARVRPRSDGAIVASSLPQMHMYPRVVFYIAFEQGPPAYGAGMLDLLNALREEVQNVAESLRGLF